MVPFIFLIIIITFILLVVSFLFKIFFMGLISSMLMIVLGVYVLSSGIETLNNLLTLTIGIILVCLGAYIFINSSLEEIKEMN